MKERRFYPPYNLRTESPEEVARGLTFVVGGRGGVQWTAVTAGLPTTVVIAVAWAFRGGLPPVVWVEFSRPKATQEVIWAEVREAGTPAEYIEETVAHAVTTARVRLLGGSTYNLNVVFHHIEVNGMERPSSRGWNVKSI